MLRAFNENGPTVGQKNRKSDYRFNNNKLKKILEFKVLRENVLT